MCGQQVEQLAETPPPPPAPPPQAEVPPPPPPPPPPAPVRHEEPEPPVEGIPVVEAPARAEPVKAAKPGPSPRSWLIPVIVVAAVVLIGAIVAAVMLLGGDGDGGGVKAIGQFVYNPIQGNRVAENSITLSINPDTREVEGECVLLIESTMSDDYWKTTIVLIGIYTPVGTGGTGKLEGTTEATYDRRTGGVPDPRDPTTDPWSADIDASGDIVGKVGSQDFNAEIVSGQLDGGGNGNGGGGEAEFQVSNLRVAPPGPINLEEGFSIVVTVENVGDAEGLYKPEIMVDGESLEMTGLGYKLEAGEEETSYPLIAAETQIQLLALEEEFDYGRIVTTQRTVTVDGLSITVDIEE